MSSESAALASNDRPLVLWQAGRGRYHTHRIPVLLAVGDLVLAWCEGRRDSGGDTGQIDLLLRRSLDGGHTWGPEIVVEDRAGFTNGNPAPVRDRLTGDLVLVFCRNRAEHGETDICAGLSDRTVWVKRSSDDGLSWSEAVEITAQVKDQRWTWYATGPVHAIALRSGRLVVPANHIDGIERDRWRDPYHAHLLLSDDGGFTWSVGAIMDPDTNESSVAELADGRLFHSARRFRGDGLRAQAMSSDAGLSESPAVSARDLVVPECQASLLSHPDGALLYSGPTGTERTDLRIRASFDDAESWSDGVSVCPGPAAYSDLALVGLGSSAGSEVLCVYETGEANPYERIELARVPAASLLTQGSR